MYLMTTACSMLGIPSIIVVCETLGNTRGVEGKMNGLCDAIRAALVAAGHDVAALNEQLSETRFMDGQKKSWANLDLDRFSQAKETLVVPGTYLAAVVKTAEHLEKSGVRPMIFVDEGDKLCKTDFLMSADETSLNCLDKALQRLYGCARVVAFVTATPCAFLNWGRLNRFKFRAFMADLDKLAALGYEIGLNIVHSHLCANVTDKDYDALSGFFLPHHKAGVEEMRALAGQARGLLAVWAINQAHNPSNTFANYDMARILVHGNEEEKKFGRHTVPVCEAWDPDAIAIVVTATKTYVTCKELAGQDGPGGWKGFKVFGKLGDATPLDRAVEWALSGRELDGVAVVSPETRPLHLMGYEAVIRSFSPRFGDRCLTHLFAHLKKGKNTDCASQLNNRACGSGVPEQLRLNGFTSCQVFSTKEDFLQCKSSAAYYREILKYALDGYVPMEHVFEGGTPGAQLPLYTEVVKKSKREHFCKRQRAHGNPPGNIGLDPTSSRQIPGMEEHEARKAEYRAQVAASIQARVAAAMPDIFAAAMPDIVAAAIEDVDANVADVVEGPVPMVEVPATRELTAADRVLVAVYRFVEGEVAREFLKADATRAYPCVSEGRDTPLRRLVTKGFLAHFGVQTSGRYALTAPGKAHAEELMA